MGFAADFITENDNSKKNNDNRDTLVSSKKIGNIQDYSRNQDHLCYHQSDGLYFVAFFHLPYSGPSRKMLLKEQK